MKRTNIVNRIIVLAQAICLSFLFLATATSQGATITIGNGSTVNVASNNHFPPPTDTVQFNTHNNGYTVVSAVGGAWSVANPITITGTSFGGQRFNFDGSNDLNFTNQVTITGQASGSDNQRSTGIGVLGTGILTLSGGIDEVNANSPFYLYGTGTLALTGASTYTGITRLTGGVLRANSGVGLSSSNLNMIGGILETSGIFNRATGSGVNQINWSGTGGFSAIGGTLTVDLDTAGASNLSWNGSGARILGPGFNAGGVLIFGSTNSDNKVTFVDNLNLHGSQNAAPLTSREIQVVDNPATTADFAEMSGVLSSSGSVNSLIKSGTGRLDLNGDNTYNGTTTVLEGTLNINGITTGQGNYTVDNGASLGGNGIIGLASGQNVTVDGNLTPGTSVGELTIGGVGSGLTINGTYVWELGALVDDSTGTAGTDFDSVVVTSGDIVLGGSSVLSLDWSAVAAPDSADPFWSESHTWTILAQGGAGTTTGLFSSLQNADYAAGEFSLTNFGGGIQLNFTPPVPEPASIWLLGLGMIGLTRKLRRGPKA